MAVAHASGKLMDEHTRSGLRCSEREADMEKQVAARSMQGTKRTTVDLQRARSAFLPFAPCEAVLDVSPSRMS